VHERPADQRPADEPPEPAVGSARCFALLYTPAARRAQLARLAALADEIGAGLARGLEHALAHARLDWWRLEAQRHAQGQARHPWLRPPAVASSSFDLQPLVEAAALDLAQDLRDGQSGPCPGRELQGALFIAAASVLGLEPSSPPLRETLRALAALSMGCDSPVTLSTLAGQLSARQQPSVAPLLVWAALGSAAKGPSRWRPWADNIRAWNVARRAAAGRYTSR
jgi:hypothetical protein